MSDAIKDLAADLLSVERHWHKRMIRAGSNAMFPYHANPPERLIEDDDIVYADLGPIFGEWEADFGRTYVLGDDPDKHRLREALPVVFDAGRAHFESRPDITGEQLFAFMVARAKVRLGVGRHDRGPPGRRVPPRACRRRRRLLAHHAWQRPTDAWRRSRRQGPRTGFSRCTSSTGHREIGGFYEELLDL